MKEASVKKLRELYTGMLSSKAVRVGIMGLCALMFVYIFNTAAFGQADVGTISGLVTDQTGAVIPNASVTVTNEGTHETRTVLSDGSGHYSVPNIVPAQYTVSVTAAGFQRYTSTHNTLQSNSAVEIDAKMTVGAASSTVQVTSTAQVLQTQSATVQAEVTGSQVSALELNGRNPLYMVQFIPGMTGTNNIDGFNYSRAGGQVAANANGARGQDVENWIDGAPAIRTRDDGETIGGISTDSVQEVQVLTDNYQAEYGTGSGAEVRVVTKAGTRDFHGALYEYLRNSAAIANTYSRKEVASTSYTTPFRYNDYGYAVGGPVWIPGSGILSHSRDRAFFFVSQEWIKLRQYATQNDAVPTALMRQGDFSELSNGGALSGVYYPAGTLLKDPQSCYSSGSYVAANCGVTYMTETGYNKIPGYTGSPYDYNDDGAFIGNVLPNSVNGMAFDNVTPPPTPGYQSGTANMEDALANPYNQRLDQWNADVLITPNNHVEFRRSDIAYTQYAPTNGPFNLTPLAWVRPNQTNALGYEWTIKPTMINEVRVTASADRVEIPAGPPAPLLPNQKYSNGYDRTLFGFNFPLIYPVSVFPRGTAVSPANNKIPGYTTNDSFTSVSGTAYPSGSSGPIYVLSDSLTWVRGNHTLKFGFYAQKAGERDNDQINVSTVPGGASNQMGTFTGSKDNTGVSIANEFLGLSDTYNEIASRAYTDWKEYLYEGFGQDNWQVSPKLHLDFGLRWTTTVAPFARLGNSDDFDPALYSPASAPVVDRTTDLINTATSTTPFDGMVIPGISGFPAEALKRGVSAANPANWTNASAVLASCENEPCSNLFGPNFKKGFYPTANAVQPRFGFAYQLTPTLVIRGGGGRFIQNKLIVDNIFPGGNSPFQPTTTVATPRDNAAGTGPYQQVDNPTVGIAASEVPVLSITAYNPKTVSPSRYDWNVSYEKQFAGIHSTMTASYVGAVTNHNWVAGDINQPAAGTAEANPSTRIDALRPYQGYTFLTQLQSVANQNYKALEIGWTSHFTEGSSIGGAYTFARSMDGGSTYRDLYPDNYYNLNVWGRSSYDIKSALIVNYDYLLPFYKGQRNMMGETLGGWEVSGDMQFQTGNPQTVGGSGDYAGISQGGGVVSSTVVGSTTLYTTASGAADGSMSNLQGGNFWSHTGQANLVKGYAGPHGVDGALQWFLGCGPGNATVCGAANQNFVAPTAGTFVTQQGVRDIIPNPGIKSWNMSAIKTFPVSESSAFEFHFDCYDLFNHANLGGATMNATFEPVRRNHRQER